MYKRHSDMPLRSFRTTDNLQLCSVELQPPAAVHEQIAPEWERSTAHIEADPESKKQLGWVREMYAWSVGAALQARPQ